MALLRADGKIIYRGRLVGCNASMTDIKAATKPVFIFDKHKLDAKRERRLLELQEKMEMRKLLFKGLK